MSTTSSINPTLLQQLAQLGSDVTLWYSIKSPNNPSAPPQIQSANMKLFFRTGNPETYGRVGTLFWAPIPTSSTTPIVLDESNTTRRFDLSKITDLKQFKQTTLFRSPACEQIQSELCFSLASREYELNLQFTTSVERELWWKVILAQLENTGRKLLQDSPQTSGSPAPTSSASPAPPTTSSQSSSNGKESASKKLQLNSTPEELVRILSEGSPFKKYDLIDGGKKVVVTDVICFTSGVGRAGLLHWIPAGSPSLTPIPGSTLPLGKITDILMKKKSPAFKSPDPLSAQAKDDACFALVTEAYTLSLEANNKEQRTVWQEGLIAMLTSAGKQLLRKTPSVPSAGRGSVISMEDSSSPTNRRSGGSNDLPPTVAAAVSGVEAQALITGTNFHIYHSNPQTGSVTRHWIHVFYVPSETVPDAPGYLYYSNKVGDRTLQATQRLPLVSIVEMAQGTKSPAQGKIFTSGVGLEANPDFVTTLRSNSITWNLEVIPIANQLANGKEIRDSFLRNITAVINKYREATTGRGSVSNGSLSPTNPPITSPAILSELQMLRDGQTFSRYTLSSKGELESQQVVVWFVDDLTTITDKSPGTLYFVPAQQPKIPSDSAKFPLGTVQTMAAGKESVLFKSPQAKSLSVEKCMSIVSSTLILDLEAPLMDIRERWIKALHGLMLRHGRKAVEQRAQAQAQAAAQQQQAQAGSPPLIAIRKASVTDASSPTSPTNAQSSSSSAIPPFMIPTSDEHLNSLQSGLPCTVFYTTAKGETLSAEIHLFLVIPLLSGSSLNSSGTTPVDALNLPGSNLHWCGASGSRKVIDGQKLSLASIKEMKEGKEGSAIMKHDVAKTYPPQKCFQIVGAQLTLNLATQTQEAKEKFMIALDYLIKKVRVAANGRGSIIAGSASALPVQQQQFTTMVASSTSSSSASPPAPTTPAHDGPHPNPLSPNSPASPALAAKPVLTAVDHKSAVALLQTGQTFTMFSYHTDVNRGLLNEERKEQVTIYFTPSNGVDSPGTLHWTWPGQPRVPQDRARTFYLNQIKQMRAGKETPILRSAIAASSNVNCCLTLFSLNAIWNLEAPTADIREAWMKALHQVLIRHGMKATDDAKAAAAAAAAAQQQAAQASSAVSSSVKPVPINGGGGAVLPSSTRALPAKDAQAAMNNRTINFSDPTDFFLLQSKIGEGSYGAVYKALDYRDNKSVAIKVLQFQGRDSLKLRKEIHILKQCNSPYIVGYKGAFQKASNVWIIMDYCAAGSLSDIMQIVQRTFSEAQVSCIMKHALHGLAYLHGQNKIHRDIKGGNILVTESCECKLADFGVSTSLDKTLGKNRTVIGTPHWMAPEVLCNDDYNEKADIWSLGITAYELAIGEPPHAKLHSMRAAIKIPTSPPPTLPDPERFSSDFHSFLAAALVKDFNARPSAEELLQHPFIRKSPPPTILADNVRAAMLELESKHESIDEINGLMNNSTIQPAKKHGSGGQKQANSSTRSDNSDSTFDPDDLENEVDFGGNSDTMLVGGTMVAASSAARQLPSHSNSRSDTIEYSTMVMNGEATSLSDTVVEAAAARMGIGSRGPSLSPAPALDATMLLKDDGEEDALDQFEDEDDA